MENIQKKLNINLSLENEKYKFNMILRNFKTVSIFDAHIIRDKNWLLKYMFHGENYE